MKWLFALLLIANGALFATMQSSHDKSGTEPMSEHAPLLAERIRLVSEAEAQHEPPTATTSSAATCLEWGAFTEDALARAQAALRPLQLGENEVAVRKSQGKGSSYWVYIPPLKSKQEANRKVDELKGLGIQDSFVIQENNKWHYAVSLGLFSSEEGALKYLSQLREKGVRSAKAAARNHEAGLATLSITSSKANLEADLGKLKTDFPDSELKQVKCGS